MVWAVIKKWAARTPTLYAVRYPKRKVALRGLLSSPGNTPKPAIFTTTESLSMRFLSADAPVIVPRAAATTLILRDGEAGLEVLMVKRSMQASFMPGAYVFPGGAVDAGDDTSAVRTVCDESFESLTQRVGRVTQVGELGLAYAVAGLRECFEECGLWLGNESPPANVSPDWPALRARLRARLHAGESLADVAVSAGLRLSTSGLFPWSHWVTPVGIPKRFDTLFFVTHAPGGQWPEVDAGETTSLAWVHPPQALQAQARGEFAMEFATVRTVESLLPFAAQGVAVLLAFAAAQTSLPPLHPRIQRGPDGRVEGILLPGQAGYDSV